MLFLRGLETWWGKTYNKYKTKERYRMDSGLDNSYARNVSVYCQRALHGVQDIKLSIFKEQGRTCGLALESKEERSQRGIRRGQQGPDLDDHSEDFDH